MSLSPLLNAPLVIQIHVAAALAAMLLGGCTLWREKGDRVHKVSGRLWVLLMAGVSLSSFFITAHAGPSIAGFGFIHLLSIFVLYSLTSGVRLAMRGEIKGHAQVMRSLYIQALGIAGLFTLLPGRRMNVILFGEMPELGFVVIALGGAIMWWALRKPATRAAQA